MTNIKKRHIIDSNKLSGEFYFNSILQEAYSCGLLTRFDIENIQLQCISLLAYKSERYNMGHSSSIRVETAEDIMKSNLYTIGLYLKTLPNPDCAARELKEVEIADIYERGRKLLEAKFEAANKIYNMVRNNKLDTLNISYNDTLNENGIGIFFKSYNLDYEAHDIPASIDYQVCNPDNDLLGVEFIEKYLENIYLENQFTMHFEAEKIHYLLCGYDKGYADLLINIFEQVLIGVLACSLAGRNIRELRISQEDIQCLYNKLLKYDSSSLMIVICKATKIVFEELNITNPSLQRYIESSLPKIVSSIDRAVKLNALNKVFIVPVNPNIEPKIQFESGVKMDDEDYRGLIEELLSCRYSSDKLELIKEKVKSFDDLVDVLMDGQLEAEEFTAVFNTFTDVELAVLIKRYTFDCEVQAVGLSEGEEMVRLYLENYIKQLPSNRQEEIFRIEGQIIEG